MGLVPVQVPIASGAHVASQSHLAVAVLTAEDLTHAGAAPGPEGAREAHVALPEEALRLVLGGGRGERGRRSGGEAVG